MRDGGEAGVTAERGADRAGVGAGGDGREHGAVARDAADDHGLACSGDRTSVGAAPDRAVVPADDAANALKAAGDARTVRAVLHCAVELAADAADELIAGEGGLRDRHVSDAALRTPEEAHVIRQRNGAAQAGNGLAAAVEATVKARVLFAAADDRAPAVADGEPFAAAEVDAAELAAEPAVVRAVRVGHEVVDRVGERRELLRAADHIGLVRRATARPGNRRRCAPPRPVSVIFPRGFGAVNEHGLIVFADETIMWGE